MVKLAASCLGWLEEDQNKALRYLSDSNFHSIEVVPNKLFGSGYADDLKRCLSIKERIWNEYHLTMDVAQAIWYGQEGSIFDLTKQAAILDFNKKLLDWASGIGLNILVLGAPRNRNVPDELLLNKQKTNEVAFNFFQKLGDLARSYNIGFALEPVNEIYNSNFLTTTQDTLTFLKKLNHPAIGMNFDFGSWFLESTSYDYLTEDDILFIKHIHISKPHLKAIESSDIELMQQTLRVIWKNQIVSLETLNQSLDQFTSSVKNTVEIGNFCDK